MKNKSKILIPVIISSILFTGCSAKDMADTSSRASIELHTEGNEAAFEESFETPNSDNINNETNETAEKENNTSQKVIRKEMLVYSCNMSVDVLDFDSALDSFKDSFDSYGAFIEKEHYSDGKASDKWIYEDDETWKSYNATIRVPSKDYDAFCDFTASLGDLRNKEANVDNLTREYYDLSTTLEIYEAKEQRYIELLSTIDDEQTAIAVEKELTDIQIQISKLVTRMNEIQTDVAYSYVYVTINEVREYVEDEPVEVKEDTFGQRFMDTVSNSFSVFLTLMENLLFIFIYLLPHLLTIGIFVFIVVLICKAFAKHKRAKYTNNINPIQTVQQPANQPVPTAETKKGNAETEENNNK